MLAKNWNLVKRTCDAAVAKCEQLKKESLSAQIKVFDTQTQVIQLQSNSDQTRQICNVVLVKLRFCTM